MKNLSSLTAIALLASNASARGVPTNVRNFYSRIKTGQCVDGQVLQSGFYSEIDGPQSKPSLSQ
jgi:hypothetical protein